MDIVQSIYNSSPLRISDVRFVVDRFMDELKKIMSEGGGVELRGFGSFTVKTRKGKSNAHNPANPSEKVRTEDHGVVVFRSGKELKQSVWGLTESRR